METLTVVEQALIISAIGIALIFAILFILWGLMAGLVRVTAPPAQQQEAPVLAAATTDTDDAPQRAAVVAVAVALALAAQEQMSPTPTQPGQRAISPWQATIRGNAMSRRAGVFRRNPPPQ